MSKPLVAKLQASLDSGELFNIVDDCLANSQVLQKLGYSAKGQYTCIVKQFLLDNDIDISHFTPNGKPLVPKIEKVCPVCSSKFKTEPRSFGEQITCSRSCSNTYFRSGENHPSYVDGKTSYRNKALKEYGEKCSICGFEDKRSLEVHHIDKNRNNNELDNLVVLCANCHLITHSLS